MIKIAILFSLSVFVMPVFVMHSPSVNAHSSQQAKCAKYKSKLDNIQSKQRQPNSVKRSNKLKEQEHKAFKKWRKCQQGKLK